MLNQLYVHKAFLIKNYPAYFKALKLIIMKKIYLIIAILSLAYSNLHSQLKFKTGLIAGPTSTSVDIVIQPVNTSFTGYPTNVIFILQIPSGVTQPAIVKTSLSPYFTSFNDLPTLPNEGGYTTYGFSAVNVTNTTNTTINSGDNYPVLRLSFSGGPITPTDIRLAHLADGGPSSLHQNYVEVNAVPGGVNEYTNFVQMFFGSLVIPAAPLANETIGYSTYQYAQISQLLPLNWLSFNVIKQGNDGLLNWIVANDGDNHHYELQRSANGTSDFKTIATVNKSTSTDYKYTDAGINNLGASVLYYRIKQVDVNGKTSYSDIRQLRLNVKGSQISVFPNPVEKGFYVNIPFTNTDNKKIRLNLVAATGQTVVSREITTAQASNYYFDIRDKNLAAGSYNLQIVFEDKTTETKKLNIIR
jgi:Secretion system C-terminal sorting domain